MFDIDKMYMMFPTYKALRKERQKLRDYAFKNLKGKTLQNTIDNITKVIDQLDPDDTLVNFDEERFAKILLATDNKEMLNFELDNFVEVILKSKTELAKFIKESIPNYNDVQKLKYFNYDNSKPESEQSKEALQNRLIELYKSVLTNENVIKEVMTPVDFTHVKDDILHFGDKTSNGNLSTFDPLKDIDTKYDFLSGKAGVGQQANALMDYVLGSMGNLSITNFNVPKSNSKFDQEYSAKLSSEDLKYYAEELGLNPNEVKQLQSIKIGHSLSAILNAFVDIAKDPYITRGNWVTMTTNTGNLLLRKGVHPFYVNAFLAQPIIKEYVAFSSQYESSKNQGLGTADAFIKERFGKEVYEKRNNSNTFNESLQTLRSNDFLNSTSSQMNVFATFLQYQAASKAMKKNVDASKFMVNGVGGSVNSLIISKNAVDSILDEENKYNQLEDKTKFKDNIILGFRSKFTNPNGSESMFSKYYNNVILKSEQIVKSNPKLFFTGNSVIQETFNEISNDVNGELLLDNDFGKELNRMFYSYVMSGFGSLNMQSSERKELTLKFSKEFEAFKLANKGKYAIVDELNVKQGDTLDFVGLNNRKKSKDYERKLVKSFLDLLNNEEDFANKLIKYSYLTSGFNNNASQFFTMIPSQWFNRNNINRYIIDKSKEYDKLNLENDDNFIDQFYLSNLENTKYVKSISQNQILPKSGSIEGFVMKNPGKTSYFRFVKDSQGIDPDTYYKLIGYNKDYQGIYTRFIYNINDELTQIKPLNVKDKKGNRIINYDVNGINLKPLTETAPKLAENINKVKLANLYSNVVYNRDVFYRENVILKKEDDVEITNTTENKFESKGLIRTISNDYGVVKVETEPIIEKTKEFVNLIAPQVKVQTYKENKGKFANEMFHYGLMWARKKETSKPVNIKSYEKSGYYAYHNLDQNGNALPSISVLQPIIDEIQNNLGLDMSNYDSVIGNIYLDGQYVYPHKDTTESVSARKYPVIVYTIGNDAGLGIVDNNEGKMTFANEYDTQWLPNQDKLKGYTNELKTKNGSIYTFGLEGNGRFELTHSTPIKSVKKQQFPPLTLPSGQVITNYTITLTFRRAQDLTTDMETEPKKLDNFKIDNSELNVETIVDVFNNYSERINNKIKEREGLFGEDMTLEQFKQITKEFNSKEELIEFIEKCY